MVHKQALARIISFEAACLSFVDSRISEAGKTTHREMILKLSGLEEESKEDKIFLSVEK